MKTHEDKMKTHIRHTESKTTPVTFTHSGSRKSKFELSSIAVAVTVAIAIQPSPSNAGQERTILEEIIVTAQKRSESLQDVPISVTAVDGEKIAEAAIHDMQALSGHVPGLIVATDPLFPNIYIRGVGSGRNRGFEQSVGMYIDGVYMGRAEQYFGPLFDIERAEVLRGPQGVLFGRNTIGGVVNITTASSAVDEEFGGKVSIEYEPELNTRNISTVLKGSVSDAVGLRLAVSKNETDGWVDNKLTGNMEPHNDSTLIRFSLNAAPTDDIDLALKLSHSKIDIDGRQTVINGVTPLADPAILSSSGMSPLAPFAFGVLNTAFPELVNYTGDEFVRYTNGDAFGSSDEEGIDSEIDNLALNLNWALGEYTLAGTLGYSEFEFFSRSDVDFLPVTFIGTTNDFDFDQSSFELRLESPVDGKVSWVAGIYAEDQSLSVDYNTKVDGTFGQPDTLGSLLGVSSLFPALTGGAYNANVIARVGGWSQDSETLATFFQAKWDITDTVSITAGVRYAKDKKTIDKETVFVDDILGLDRANADPSYVNQPLLDASWALLGTFRHNLTDVSQDEEHTSPAVKMEWSANDDSLLYLSYSEGYKSSGFNGADEVGTIDTNADGIGDTPDSDFAFEPEEASTWELGGKHTLSGGSMRLNWAIFHTKYENLQVTAFDGTNFIVGNAASATIEGMEADWAWQALDSLQIGANIAYLDFEYDEFPTAQCTVAQDLAHHLAASPGGTCQQDLKGQTTPFAPEWSGALYADYTRELSGGYSLKLGADANFRDEFYTESSLEPDGLQEATWKINLRAALLSPDEAWEIAVYGNNVTDEFTRTSGAAAPLYPGIFVDTIEQGSSWGIRGTYNF